VPISSLVVHAEERCHSNVCGLLNGHPAIEVVHVSESAIAIVTETPDGSVDKLLWRQIEALSGVTHLELVYHNFEDGKEYHHVS